MAEFQKLSEVEKLETASDNASVLVEEGGEIKRVPKKEVGGAGIKTAIIKDSGYDNALAGVQTLATIIPSYTYECINMTFEEAYQTMANGESLGVFGMLTGEGAVNLYGTSIFLGNAAFGVPCIGIAFMLGNATIAQLYWTADGLSAEPPSSSN